MKERKKTRKKLNRASVCSEKKLGNLIKKFSDLNFKKGGVLGGAPGWLVQL